jgi:release factor glutamine methyltransferase
VSPESLLILAKIRGVSYQTLLLNLPSNLSITEQKLLNLLTKKYKSGFPLAYILGEIEFLNRKFLLSPDVLIPRPETEEWVANLILGFQKNNFNTKSLNILEIGTGSGVIGLSLLHGLASKINKIVLTDISPKALKIAKLNHKKHNISKNNQPQPFFVKSDLLADIANLKNSFSSNKKLNILVANLPYLPENDKLSDTFKTLQHEPAKALYSGEDGLDTFKSLIHQVKLLGLDFHEIYFELDPRNILNASNIVLKIFETHFKIDILKDFNGHDRVLKLVKLV